MHSGGLAATISALALSACSGAGARAAAVSPPAPPPASAPAPAGSAPAAAAAAPAVPTACADPAASVCTPAEAFVELLCQKTHQDEALALFAKGSPFTRLYLRGRLDELGFDEEVLALRFHAPQRGGMVVGSGNGSYDVLRWDGTCSTGVEAEMLTRSHPPQPRTARILWHRIGDRIQDALIASSEAVKRAHAKRGKECQGAMSGDVSAACASADLALGAAVADYVRTRGVLPEPEPLR